MENQGGKRVMQGGGRPRGAKIALIVVLVLALLSAAGYVGLCVYAEHSGAFLPNTTVGGVEVGGRTLAQASAALAEQLPARLSRLSVPFVCGGKEYTVSGSELAFDADAAARQASSGQRGHFFAAGARFLAALLGGTDYPVPLTLAADAGAVAQAVEDCTDPEAQTTWSLTERALVLHKGRTGRTLDTAALTGALTERFALLLSGATGGTPIQAQVTTAPPAEPDFQAIYGEVHVEAADAYLDPDSKEIVASVTGVSFDAAAASARLAATEEGGTCSVPLDFQAPELSTEELSEKLFADVLGTSTTKCAAPANRWYNIDLAAARCNDIILMPGETFSYNDHAGPYTIASGYREAGTYQNGQNIDAAAGGICQLSSTLYWTTLKANLEIVERHKHQFNGGYMPVIGTDATVWSDTYDFRFKNNTEYPIKLECYQDKSHQLHVTIYGTDTTGIHGEPYHNIISTVPFQNLYKPDAGKVPVGGEPVRDENYSRYNGYTVDLYQRLVDRDGNTVKTTLLYRNTYKASNAVYYYNPADAARLGIDPATGLRNLTPVTPTPTPTPDATTPLITPLPWDTPAPDVTPGLPDFPPPQVTPTPDPLPPAVPTPGLGPGMEPVDESPAPTPTPTPTPEPEPVPTPGPPAPPVEPGE